MLTGFTVMLFLPHAVNCVRLVSDIAVFVLKRDVKLAVTFLFVYEKSRELLNGFELNSHERCVWSLAPTSLNV